MRGIYELRRQTQKWIRTTLFPWFYHRCGIVAGRVGVTCRGESKPERRSGKGIIAGTAFRLEFLVGWYYDADATMVVLELY